MKEKKPGENVGYNVGIIFVVCVAIIAVAITVRVVRWILGI